MYCIVVSQSDTCSPVACMLRVRRLPVTFLTYCILGSYNAQADIGDFDPTRHAVPGYLRGIPFAPPNLQSAEMGGEIASLHALHQGMEPERADHIYLDNARRLALYGLHLYDSKARALSSPLPAHLLLAFRTGVQLSTRPRTRPVAALSRVPRILPVCDAAFYFLCALFIVRPLVQCATEHAGANTRGQCALPCV